MAKYEYYMCILIAMISPAIMEFYNLWDLAHNG